MNQKVLDDLPDTAVGVPQIRTTVSSNALRVPGRGAVPLMGVFPMAGSAQRAASSQGARSKVALQPGHSPLDWAALKTNPSLNLRGIPQALFPMRVTKEELQRHRAETDCWTAIKGRVYNLTPYLDFHPGGRAELMKCAGKEGTSLFNKYHAWVNVERMLDNCMVGVYVS